MAGRPRRIARLSTLVVRFYSLPRAIFPPLSSPRPSPPPLLSPPQPGPRTIGTRPAQMGRTSVDDPERNPPERALRPVMEIMGRHCVHYGLTFFNGPIVNPKWAGHSLWAGRRRVARRDKFLKRKTDERPVQFPRHRRPLGRGQPIAVRATFQRGAGGSREGGKARQGRAGEGTRVVQKEGELQACRRRRRRLL